MNFNTKTATLKAVIKLKASIKAPTVIYQNEEYWCNDLGCQCQYSQLDEEGNENPLSPDSYEEKSKGAWTEFLVTDPALDDARINILCQRKSFEPNYEL